MGKEDVCDGLLRTDLLPIKGSLIYIRLLEPEEEAIRWCLYQVL